MLYAWEQNFVLKCGNSLQPENVEVFEMYQGLWTVKEKESESFFFAREFPESLLSCKLMNG